MQEIWKGLQYKGNDYSKFYEVSNLGRLRNAKTGQILKLWANHDQYMRHFVYLGSRKRTKNIEMHKAVACTFIPNPDNLPEVNHIDGNKGNNNISNLEWVTHQDNVTHANRIGLVNANPPQGADSPVAKLTWEQAKMIRFLYKTRNCTISELATRFSVGKGTISHVVNNKSYVQVA